MVAVEEVLLAVATKMERQVVQAVVDLLVLLLVVLLINN